MPVTKAPHAELVSLTCKPIQQLCDTPNLHSNSKACNYFFCPYLYRTIVVLPKSCFKWAHLNLTYLGRPANFKFRR